MDFPRPTDLPFINPDLPMAPPSFVMSSVTKTDRTPCRRPHAASLPLLLLKTTSMCGASEHSGGQQTQAHAVSCCPGCPCPQFARELCAQAKLTVWSEEIEAGDRTGPVLLPYVLRHKSSKKPTECRTEMPICIFSLFWHNAFSLIYRTLFSCFHMKNRKLRTQSDQFNCLC